MWDFLFENLNTAKIQIETNAVAPKSFDRITNWTFLNYIIELCRKFNLSARLQKKNHYRSIVRLTVAHHCQSQIQTLFYSYRKRTPSFLGV